MKYSAVHLQRLTSNVPSYDDMPIMAEEDLRFAYTDVLGLAQGPPPGRRRQRAVETYAALDRGDAFGGRDAKLACV